MKLLVDYIVGGNKIEKISWFGCRNGHVSIGIIRVLFIYPKQDARGSHLGGKR